MTPTCTRYVCGGFLNQLAEDITRWREKKGFVTAWNNVPEKLMLVVTELSEAMEAYRHIKFPFGRMGTIEESEYTINFREELADALIRLLDLTAALGIDIEREVRQKMLKNEQRPSKHGKEL